MQSPPGYPQQPQGQPYPHQPQGQPNPQGPQQVPPGYGPPPGYPQQYGMQQQPYYPPQKKGMPGWAWGLIVGCVLLFCGVPVLALAAIPLITSNTREARRAEGEQLMGSARDATRVQYSKTGTSPARLSQFTQLYMFEGEYYRVDDNIQATSANATITCSPIMTATDGKGRIEFAWATGESKVRWD
jgi:hypothetical protein